MTNSTNKILGIEVNQDGNSIVLCDKEFNNLEFNEIIIGPVKKDELSIKLENVVFRNCDITSRRFVVREGVILKNVVFDNVESEDALTISTNAVLENVVVKGNSKNSALWIRPDEVFDEKRDSELKNWVSSETDDIDLMLDISNYEGEVEVLGLPAEKIKFNSSCHFLITNDWKDKCDWNELDISPTSFWRLSLRRLKIFDVESGIFSLPQKNDKRIDSALVELEKLKAIGVI